MWQKMVTKLEHGKKFTNELVDQSVAAYDLREDICNKIQNLDDKGQVENNLHMQVNQLIIISPIILNLFAFF